MSAAASGPGRKPRWTEEETTAIKEAVAAGKDSLEALTVKVNEIGKNGRSTEAVKRKAAELRNSEERPSKRSKLQEQEEDDKEEDVSILPSTAAAAQPPDGTTAAAAADSAAVKVAGEQLADALLALPPAVDASEMNLAAPEISRLPPWANNALFVRRRPGQQLQLVCDFCLPGSIPIRGVVGVKDEADIKAKTKQVADGINLMCAAARLHAQLHKTGEQYAAETARSQRTVNQLEDKLKTAKQATKEEKVKRKQAEDAAAADRNAAAAAQKEIQIRLTCVRVSNTAFQGLLAEKHDLQTRLDHADGRLTMIDSREGADDAVTATLRNAARNLTPRLLSSADAS